MSNQMVSSKTKKDFEIDFNKLKQEMKKSSDKFNPESQIKIKGRHTLKLSTCFVRLKTFYIFHCPFSSSEFPEPVDVPKIFLGRRLELCLICSGSVSQVKQLQTPIELGLVTGSSPGAGGSKNTFLSPLYDRSDLVAPSWTCDIETSKDSQD
jgi:hypothetical protein